MKNKKVLILLIVIIIILAIIGFFVYQKIKQNNENNQITEYIPEEEITEEQMRNTIVSLYFNEKDTNTLIPEARTIDVKELTKDPYNVLINLLIQGPKSERLERLIPEGTKVNKIELKTHTIYLDLSKEFVDNQKDNAEFQTKTIYSIVNTLTQLNEVESVKILIDGEEDKGFTKSSVTFRDEFVKLEETI